MLRSPLRVALRPERPPFAPHTPSQLPLAPPPQVWSHYEEAPAEEAAPVLEEKERAANYKPVFVTEITDDLHFYVQDVETGGRLGPSRGGGGSGISPYPSLGAPLEWASLPLDPGYRWEN